MTFSFPGMTILKSEAQLGRACENCMYQASKLCEACKPLEHLPSFAGQCATCLRFELENPAKDAACRACTGAALEGKPDQWVWFKSTQLDLASSPAGN